MRNYILSVIGATIIALGLRVILTLGDGSILCSNASLYVKMVTVIGDFFTIVLIGLAVQLQLFKKVNDALRPNSQWTQPQFFIFWLIPLIAFIGYELISNLCILEF